MKKITIALTVLCIVFNICFGSIAFATAPTSWDDVNESAKTVALTYVQFACDVADNSTFLHEDYLELVYNLPLNWLGFVQDLGWYINPMDDIYYYLVDGELWVYEGDISSVSGGSGRSRVGSGGGEGRLRVSGDTFNDIIDRVNGYYMPSQNSDIQIVSLQNPIHPKYSADQWGWNSSKTVNYGNFVPIRLGSDMLLGKNLSEVWLFPFFIDDDVGTKYYGQYQVRLYHNIVENEDGSTTVQLVAEYHDNINGVEVTSDVLVPDLAKYPYINFKLANPGDYNLFRAYGYTTQSAFIADSPNNLLGYDTGDHGYLWSADMVTKSNIALLMEFSTFEPDINTNDDIGFFVSAEKFESKFYSQWQNVPDNYYITYDGDNINYYTITNPDTGQSDTINNYITNNYYFTDSGEDDGESGGDTINNWNISFGDFMVNLETSIINSITTTFNLLFVPSDNYFSDLSLDIENKFYEKFPFMVDIPDIFNSFFVNIRDNGNGTSELYVLDEDGEEVPVEYPVWKFTIDFYGHKIELVILDFNMFADSLSTVRVTVLAFIYLSYAWWLFKYIPTLIGGVADVTVSFGGIYDEKGGDK